MKTLPNHIPVKLESHEEKSLSSAMNTLFVIRNTMKDRGCDTLICTDIETGDTCISSADVLSAIDIIKHISNLHLMTYGNSKCASSNSHTV